MNKLIFTFFFLLIGNLCVSQTNDTINIASSSKKEEKNRNVMLNAATSSKPREISIGLPASSGGTGIFEDGMPVGQYYWPIMDHWHWAGGNSYSSAGLTSIGENAIISGNVGYAINSITRLGTDGFHTKQSITSNQFGLIKYDGNINGSLKKNLYYTLGAYLNFDPTSVNNPSVDFIERMQIYKVGLTKRWNDNRGEISFLYKYSRTAYSLHGYDTAPFYYVGDGSIELYNGFKLGIDSYMPEDDEVRYLGLADGKFYTGKIDDLSGKNVHDAVVKFDYQFDNDLKLEVRSRFGLAPKAQNVIIKDGGIEDATDMSGITYSDGSQFTGHYQQRLGIFFDADSRDIMTTVQLTKTTPNHQSRLGLNAWFNYQHVRGSSLIFYHTVEKNPDRLFYNGQRSWALNSVGEFYEGTENKIALFATDDWSPNSRLNIYYGIRLEHDHINVNTAANINGATNNTRYENFSLVDDGVTIENYSRGWLNPVAMLNASYVITGRFSLATDFLFNRRRVRLDNFCGTSLPGGEPIDTYLGRVGFLYDNSWLQLTTMASYIRSANNKQTAHFTKTIGGVSETQARTIVYDIATVGWTTDVVINPFKGFSMHMLATIQDPRYKNFDMVFEYSDGSTESLDYSEKYVGGVSKFLMELDPSYKTDKWNFWLSLRYYSKQYANKMNNVFFNGHWETFGGIEYKILDKVSLNMSVVNIFNDYGANGSIASADLITDPTLLNNYLISGKYIRPFTLEFSLKFEY